VLGSEKKIWREKGERVYKKEIKEKLRRIRVNLIYCLIQEKDGRNRRKRNMFIFKMSKIPFN
jgi:hypothetical protein